MREHLVWKRRLGRVFRAAPVRADRRVILIYHALDSGPLSLAADSFREQMGWLARNASVVPLDRLLEGPGKGLRVAITFDDGYESLARTAASILAREGFSAAAYLNTSCIGERERVASDEAKGHYPAERFLLWDEVARLKGEGWTIGSHGVEHADLTRLGGPATREQLRLSKEEIERRLGGECAHFAYTWGNHDRRVREAVAEAGYRWAAAAVHGPLRAGGDPLALPRIDVRRDYELADFAAAVRGDWDFLGPVQAARRWLR